MIRLIYNNTAFKILDEFQIEESIKEVTFNDIKIDFTGYGLSDMPLKYQEVQIKKCKDNQDILTEGNVLFFGYVDTIKLSEMKSSDSERELEITILSPRKMATLRTVTMIGTYQLDDAIRKIFEPLINDGYTLLELNIEKSQILLSYIAQSIETIMNDLGYKRNLVWSIDDKKNIKVNTIDYMFGKNISKNISSVDGLLKIDPKIEATDYANIINFKNVRLIYNGGDYASNVHTPKKFCVLSMPKVVKNGDIVEFNYPISISKEIGRQIYQEKEDDTSVTLLHLSNSYNPTTENPKIFIIIQYNGTTDNVETNIVAGTMTFSDDEGEEGNIVLQRDSFFHDLITGFKYNGNSTITIDEIYTDTALRYVTMKFVASTEIQKLKGIVSTTGQIEKNVDLNETWFTIDELTDYAKNLLISNTNVINTVELEYDTDPLLNVGDIVKIDLEDFYIQGTFAVTKIKYKYKNKLEQNWQITLQNSDIISSYIDLFRTEQSQETETQENSIIVGELIDETLTEIHDVEEVQNEG